MKLILLNGPAGSGKDTIAKMIGDKYNVIQEKLAFPIKRAIAAAFAMDKNQYEYFFETDAKNIEQDFFFGHTPREVLIGFSEIFMKPRVAHHAFAELFIRRTDNWLCANTNNPHEITFVLSDCGFNVEADYLIQQLGAANVAIVHLVREGKTFTGDSRNYVKPFIEPSFFVKFEVPEGLDTLNKEVNDTLIKALEEHGFLNSPKGKKNNSSK